MRYEREYDKVEANVYSRRIVCGKCGFRIAELKNEPDLDIPIKNYINVLCRRRGNDGVPCNTVNEIKV